MIYSLLSGVLFIAIGRAQILPKIECSGVTADAICSGAGNAVGFSLKCNRATSTCTPTCSSSDKIGCDAVGYLCDETNEYCTPCDSTFLCGTDSTCSSDGECVANTVTTETPSFDCPCASNQPQETWSCNYASLGCTEQDSECAMYCGLQSSLAAYNLDMSNQDFYDNCAAGKCPTDSPTTTTAKVTPAPTNPDNSCSTSSDCSPTNLPYCDGSYCVACTDSAQCTDSTYSECMIATGTCSDAASAFDCTANTGSSNCGDFVDSDTYKCEGTITTPISTFDVPCETYTSKCEAYCGVEEDIAIFSSDCYDAVPMASMCDPYIPADTLTGFESYCTQTSAACPTMEPTNDPTTAVPSGSPTTKAPVTAPPTKDPNADPTPPPSPKPTSSPTTVGPTEESYDCSDFNTRCKGEAQEQYSCQGDIIVSGITIDTIPCNEYDSRCEAWCMVEDKISEGYEECVASPLLTVDFCLDNLPTTNEGMEDYCFVNTQCPDVTPSPTKDPDAPSTPTTPAPVSTYDCSDIDTRCIGEPEELYSCEGDVIVLGTVYDSIPCTSHESECSAYCMIADKINEGYEECIEYGLGADICDDNIPTIDESMTDFCTVNSQCSDDSATTTTEAAETTSTEAATTVTLDCNDDDNFWRTDCIDTPNGDGCSLLLSLEVDICILDLRWERDLLFKEMKLPIILLMAANEIDFCSDISDLSIESFNFEWADSSTEMMAVGAFNTCPNVDTQCDRSKRGGLRFPITISVEIGLYCGTCADTKEMGKSIYSLMNDGSFAPEFIAECLSTTAGDDEYCDVGFGGVEIESATVAYRNADGEVEGGVINIVGDKSSAHAMKMVTTFWMVVLALFCFY